MIEPEKKNGDKDGKALYKSRNIAFYGKTIQNLRNRIDVKRLSNIKDYSNWTCRPSYMWHKIFVNDLVTIPKIKDIFTLNKAEKTGM